MYLLSFWVNVAVVKNKFYLPMVGDNWYAHLLNKGDTSPGLRLAGCDQKELNKLEG